MNAPSSWLRIAGLAAWLAASAAAANTGPQCSDPCLEAARAERADCLMSASGVFVDTVTGCPKRDHRCVDACRTGRQDCRDATGLGTELVRCNVALDAEKARCRATLPPGSVRHVICVGRAQVAGSRCRRTAFRGLRGELEECRSSFDRCADACGPGEPPGGGDPCRAERERTRQAAVDACRVAYRATASACLNRDIPCVQDCGEARETCSAPTKSTLDAALASCTAERNAAVAACTQADPGGGVALEQCVSAAQSTAWTCRETALAAAQAGFEPCAAGYARCVPACPRV